jgi:hypothetical protein
MFPDNVVDFGMLLKELKKSILKTRKNIYTYSKNNKRLNCLLAVVRAKVNMILQRPKNIAPRAKTVTTLL